jgi:hypothetical protein
VTALLAGAAYGYYRFIYYPSTPRFAVEQLFEAGRARDYERVYSLVKVSGPFKSLVRGPEDLKRYAEQFPGLIPDVQEYRVLKSDVQGDRATVTSEVTASQAGRTNDRAVDFRLVREEGIWRIDGEWVIQEALRTGLGGALLRGAEE